MKFKIGDEVKIIGIPEGGNSDIPLRIRKKIINKTGKIIYIIDSNPDTDYHSTCYYIKPKEKNLCCHKFVFPNYRYLQKCIAIINAKLELIDEHQFLIPM